MFANMPGFCIPVGPSLFGIGQIAAPAMSSVGLMDATNEGLIVVGRIITADGGSHTLDTTGSSSIGWRSAAVTFANGATVVKVGLAAVDTATGPPGRAANAANVVTFDVNATHTGSGITTTAWQTSVPTAGTKTIANGDLVAFAIQMTNRAGVDSVIISMPAGLAVHRPAITAYISATYAGQSAYPNILITFSDGTLGWFQGGDIASTILTTTYNSGSSPNEYGQLYSLPVPVKVHGLYAVVDPDADFDMVLYSDPLGTPVAEKTASVDANTVATTTARRILEMFPAPYTAGANQPIAAIMKPGGSSSTLYGKTLQAATHRVADPWGTTGYGVSRASGAFADISSGTSHYFVGLIVSAFEHGVWPGGHLGA